MPRYYFDVKNGHRLVDPNGIDCPTDDEAAKQAKVIADQIAQDVPSSATKRRIAVRDVEGREVATIKVGEKDGGQ